MKYTLPTSKDKPKYIQEKFEGIAKKYDLFNDIITFGMHRYWKKILVKKIELKTNNTCLDLCCGTGDISNEISRQYPEIKITGLDFSKEMLKIATTKISNNQNINFLHGDAMNIPFPDLKFDYIMANPPFNISDWGGEKYENDVRWKYGIPPKGNANFAWVQHFVHHLSPTGTAGFVLANGSLSSNRQQWPNCDRFFTWTYVGSI